MGTHAAGADLHEEIGHRFSPPCYGSTRSASPLMATPAAVISIFEALRLMVIPADVISTFAASATAGGLTSRMTPPPPGRSFSVRVTASVLRILAAICCGPGAGLGASPVPQKPPDQIGKSTSPPSNSTQSWAPTGGVMERPTPGPA